MLKRKSKVFRIICGLLVFLLFENNLERIQAQDTPFLAHLQNNILELSASYSLPVLRGMRVYPDKPFEFDFVVDSGDRHTFDQKETSLLVKYFLTCLTVPEQDLWVNLSPYESGRIIPDELALTNAGNTLLEQDKLLKQLASSLTYPETRLGKKFWAQVYKRTYEKFGTTELPVNTYNKVWIVPDKAIVYDMGNSALIGQTHLKVMLEEDYLALKKHKTEAPQGNNPNALPTHAITSIITREIILPELEKEINEGKNFAPVRQIFHSMVLAAWFKRTLKRNVLTDVYVNKKKISGIDGVDKNSKEEIYKQYLHIYKVGAYNYIREDVDPVSQQVVPRKYFSGGLFFGDLDRAMKTLQVPDFNALKPYLDMAQMAGSFYGVARVRLNPIGQNPIGPLSRRDSTRRVPPPSLKEFVLTVARAVMPSASQRDSAQLTAALTLPLHLQERQQRVSQQEEQIQMDKVKALSRLLDSVVDGEVGLSDPDPADTRQNIGAKLADSILNLLQTGHSSIVREFIFFYQTLLAPQDRIHTKLFPQVTATESEFEKLRAGLTQQQQQTIADLLYMMQMEYLAENPLEAINELEILPLQIQSASNIYSDTAADLARRIVRAGEAIKNNWDWMLSWDDNTLFPQGPVTVKIVEQISKANPGTVIKYDIYSDKIEIGKDALLLDQDTFTLRLNQAYRKAVLHRMAQVLGKVLGIDRDTQSTLEGKMASIVGRGTSLSEFILFCNMSDRLTLQKVNDILDMLFYQGELGPDKVENYIALKHAEDGARAKAHKPSSRFVKAFKPVITYLINHPKAAIIPAILLSALALAVAAHGAPFDQIPGGHADSPQPGSSLQASGASGHILHFADQITSADREDIQKIRNIVHLEDVIALNGHKNQSPNGGIYNVDINWVARNWDHSFQEDREGRVLEAIIVAAQHKLGLPEDGCLGPQTRQALGDTGGKPAESHMAAASPSGTPSSQDNLVQATSSGATRIFNDAHAQVQKIHADNVRYSRKMAGAVNHLADNVIVEQKSADGEINYGLDRPATDVNYKVYLAQRDKVLADANVSDKDKENIRKRSDQLEKELLRNKYTEPETSTAVSTGPGATGIFNEAYAKVRGINVGDVKYSPKMAGAVNYLADNVIVLQKSADGEINYGLDRPATDVNYKVYLAQRDKVLADANVSDKDKENIRKRSDQLEKELLRNKYTESETNTVAPTGPGSTGIFDEAYAEVGKIHADNVHYSRKMAGAVNYLADNVIVTQEGAEINYGLNSEATGINYKAYSIEKNRVLADPNVSDTDKDKVRQRADRLRRQLEDNQFKIPEAAAPAANAPAVTPAPVPASPSAEIAPVVQPAVQPAVPPAAQLAENVPEQVVASAPVSAPAPLPAAEVVPAVVPQSINNPAPQLVQQPSHVGKSFYQVPVTTVATIPVQDHVVAKTSGFVTGLDPDKKEYQAGETIFTLQNPELDSRIEALKAQLQIYESKLADLKALREAYQAATDQEIKQAQQQAQEVKQKLAQANEEKINSTVTAPNHLKVIDIQVANGTSVSKGTQLLRYDDLQRVRIDMEVPSTVNYFNDITLALNGAPVKSIFSYKWSGTSSPERILLSLIVIPSSPIPPGQSVRVSAKIYSPDKDSKMLYSIVGNQTTQGVVGKVEEYPLTAPAAGGVNFLVHEGDNVQAGQLLAQVDAQSYQEELAEINRQIGNVDDQLNQAAPAADGTQYIDRDKVDSLKVQKVKLSAQQRTLQEQMARMEIRAPYDGVIDWSAEHGAGVFQNQDVLFHISTGTVFLGNINDTKGAILFSKGSNVRSGDPVLVRTPNGSRLLAIVTAVNNSPNSLLMQLSQVSIEVKTFDPQHTLRPGLPVQVTLLTEKEKQAALNILSAAIHAMPSSASPPPPPPPKGPLDRMGSQLILGQNPIAPGIALIVPQAYFSPKSPALNMGQLEQQVMGNKLLTADQASDYLQKKLSEKFPGAKSFDLTAGVWSAGNGKLSYVGGIQGAIQDIAGQFFKGNAINPTSAALDILFDFSGKIIDHFDHKIAKEKALATQVTMTAFYGLQNASYQQVNHAKRIFIELGVVQQEKARLEQLKVDLETSRAEMLARESGGFTSTGDRLSLEEKVSETKLQISELERNIQSLTVELNVLIGQSRTDLRKPIFVALPWTGNFTSISQAQEQEWLTKLTGEESPDPRMQEAFSARKVMARTMALQRLKRLPSINLAGVLTPPDPQDGIKNSIFEPLGGETWRVSEMAPGKNLALQLDIPVFDKQRKTLDQILGLEQGKTESKIEKTKMDLAEELTRSVGNIRNLSEEIHQAQEAYNIACHVWALKAGRPDLYLPHDLVNERIKMDQSLGEVLKLKAQYLKEEANLRQLGLLQPGESLVKDKAMNADQAQLSRRLLLAGILALAVAPLTAQQADEQPTGSFGYDTNTWALTHGGPLLNKGALADLENILIHDPNPLNRWNALPHYLSEYQDNNGAVLSMTRVILFSPYPDVVQELLRFMVARKDIDLRFFIQIIKKAQEKHNKGLVALAYQSLEDVLTNNPDQWSSLSSARDFIASSTYPEVTPEIAKKVFLTFLASGSLDSMAKTRFLQSQYWSPEELAQIYTELNAYVKNHPDAPQVDQLKNLAGLIYDSILRKKALENIDQVFSLGPLEQPPGEAGGLFNYWNAISRVRTLAWRAQNRRFLNSSGWRKMKEYISPRLFAKAQAITRELVDGHWTSLEMSGAPFYDIFYNGPVTKGYFNSLDLSGQSEYVAKTDNISELARIFQSSTFFRAIILDRLMASRDGRLLVLEAYWGSEDPGFLNLIESRRNWQSLIKEDAGATEDPAADRIFRNALKKMYDRTQQEGLLNVLLNMYSALELHSPGAVADPRGDIFRTAQIKRVAAQWAIKALIDCGDHRPVLWGGFTTRTQEELDKLDEIAVKMKNEDDPLKIDAYLTEEQARHANSKSKPILDDLMSIRAGYAGLITNNDQRVTLLPVIGNIQLGLYFATFGLFSFLLSSRIFYNKFSHRGTLTEVADRLEKVVFDLKKNNGHGQDRAMVVVSRQDTYGPTFTHLSIWREILSRWGQQDHYPIKDMLTDFNTILNLSAEVIRVMPYSPDLMWRNGGEEKHPLNEEYRESFDYFFNFAFRTLDILSDRLKTANSSEALLNETQRQRFLQDTNAMLENMQYVSDYLRILKHRATIERVMNYKFDDSDWREKTRLYPLIRAILLYGTLWKRSRKRIHHELRSLLVEGNNLRQNFYGDDDAIDTIVKDSESRLAGVISAGKTAYAPPQAREERIAFKNRSFYSRMMFMLAPGQLLVVLSALLVGGVSGTSIGTLIGSFLIAFVSLSVFWLPHIESLKMDKSHTMTWLKDKLYDRLNNLLDPSGEYASQYQNENRGLSQKEKQIEDLAKQEGQEQADIELSAPQPRADAIVIIAEDPQDVPGLQRHIDQIRGKIIREKEKKDVIVEVVHPEFQGSGNAVLDTFRKVKKNFDTGAYTKEYPNLNRSWKDARAIYVFLGKDFSHPLDYTLVDWQIINGYRVLASMPQSWDRQEAKGAAVITVGRKPYYGPVQMVPGSDITLLTSRVKRDDLRKLGYVHMDYSGDGDPGVIEVWEKFDILSTKQRDEKEHKRSETLQHMESEELYNLSNGAFKQFLASVGISFLGPDAVDMFTRIAERVENSALREKLKRIHLTGDLLIPQIIIGNLKDPMDVGREIEKYVGARSRWLDLAKGLTNGDLRVIQDALTEFYNMVNQEIKGNPLKFKAFAPHPGAEVYHPQLTSDTGGIDLNFQPQFISQPSKVGSVGFQQAAISNMPMGFLGFNFNIVSFTSELTANSAVQLMFSSK